ncbi:GntR family transcriptional regulator [Marinobacterium zhoushanense]|uniref:GntR family transcriptional regulator n=1 Tax=Marinobacterium zhoushanense TaxID=1679163 RepID=A0ABQ1JXH8_9GAMM|nr:GntR family transcriptional regulator [Marinobacterium zhoushanense]GGB81420.1 GntR family transcriptional regulator [Marinobacterium zhoushanense]
MAKRAIKEFEELGHNTLTTSVFERLRSDILEGVFSPNEKLRVEALRRRYDVGASPIREALNRLAALRLVEQTDQRGFRVTELTKEDIQELAVTRCWISEIAIREAIAHGDKEWEEAIALAYYRLWRHPVDPVKDGPDRDWEVLHREFHSALISACPSRWIRDFHEQLFDYADRHRHLANKAGHPRQDPAEEHKAIMEAVVTRNTELAIKLLNQHFTLTSELAEEASLAS